MTPIADASDEELAARAKYFRSQLDPILVEMSHRRAAKRTDAENHAICAHPDYEYETTEGPRKGFDEHQPSTEPGETPWERNIHMGRNGWERFDYTEEAYWMRRKAKP